MEPAGDLRLTGVLAKSDPSGRLRLCLVDVLESRGGAYDGSWRRLRAAIPPSAAYAVPYRFDLGGAPDDAGVRGECWITLPRGKARRRRLAEYAAALVGKEVEVTVRPKRYSFVSWARHNHGATVAGTSLQYVGGLEALAPR